MYRINGATWTHGSNRRNRHDRINRNNWNHGSNGCNRTYGYDRYDGSNRTYG